MGEPVLYPSAGILRMPDVSHAVKVSDRAGNQVLTA